MKTEFLVLLAGMMVIVFTILQPTPQSSADKPTATPASREGTAAVEKTAGEAMKNVQVLKDIPASQWNSAMVFIGASLGVGCEHCHAQPYDSDTKKAKQTARNMMRMVREINAANFNGNPVVTCNTCHQGNLQPKAALSPWNKTPEEVAAIKKQREAEQAGTSAQPVAAKPAESLPAGQTFAAYRTAVGTNPVSSIHLSASVASEFQQPRTLEVDAVLPDKLFIHNSLPGGADIRTFTNGDRGWNINPSATRDLSLSEVEGLRENFDQTLAPVKFTKAAASGKMTGTEKIFDRTYAVVESETPKTTERLYFDSQSGLLYKAHLENRISGFAVLPFDVLYEDYREVSGVKYPFSVTVVSPSDHIHLAISELQMNVAIDPAKFQAPPAK
jgi:hypothetical protein